MFMAIKMFTLVMLILSSFNLGMTTKEYIEHQDSESLVNAVRFSIVIMLISLVFFCSVWIFNAGISFRMGLE